MADTLIKKKLLSIPQKTGVYKFYNKNNDLIYVGKAKNIKKRVSSYFTKTKKNAKTTLLIKKINDIQCVVVDTEMDALLLENNLIKNYQPKYNVLLKDGKTYPWICITKDELPKVYQTRKVKNDGSEYYGPYPSSKLIKLFLNYFSDLFYDSGWQPYAYVNRSLDKKTKEDYLNIILKIKKILKGDLRGFINVLTKKMYYYSKLLDFEKAQKIKEHLVSLKNYQSKSTITHSRINNVDVFSILDVGKYAYVNYLKIMSGSVVQAHTIEMKKKLDENTDDLLRLAIVNIRDRFNSTSKIIICSKNINSFLTNVNFVFPKIGDKKKLIELSLNNAKLLMLQKEKDRASFSSKVKNNFAVKQIKKDLNLMILPTHIECFDNSNTQGTNSVSACVVFKNGKACKNEYRHFTIKKTVGANDYANMEEVVYRRYFSLLKEKKELPQLIVVDGGRGQLNSAIKSLKKLKLEKNISIIGIAKKLEEIYTPFDNMPLYIDKRSESLKLIQRLRNEAHRFSLKHHKKKRTKMSLSSSLDNINGVGLKTKELLLKKFNSLNKIRQAEKKDLEKLIGKNKAEKILLFYSSSS